jgi:hypothetical protein
MNELKRFFINLWVILKNIVLILLMVLVSPITIPLSKFLKNRKTK